MTNTASRLISGCAAFAIAAGISFHVAPAKAGVFIAFPPIGFGGSVAPYPPSYDYPPAYYPPPYGYPAYAPPPAPQMSQADTPYGSICYAGFYTCAAPAQTHIGEGCSCAGLGAPSYGTVR